MQTQTTYSCHIHSLDNLPGERWKSIEGYEDFYQVSSHGRIKSLSRPREVIHNKSGETFTYWTKEKIRRIKIHQKWNAVIGAPLFECTVELSRDAIKKTFLVHRLVYHAFVEALHFDSDRLMVMHINGDGLDNHYLNLVAGSRSTVSGTAYQRKRHISPFALKNKKDLQEIHGRAGISRQKKVMQYSLDGQYIHTYDSITLAALTVGTGDTNIICTLKGKAKTAAGYTWRYFHDQ